METEILHSDVSIMSDGSIMTELYSDTQGTIKTIVRNLVKTRDEQVRESLKKMGWSTPEETKELHDKIERVLQWCDAYPVDIFPEPDLKKAAKALKENGMTLDSISASNMRHVLKGVKEILKKETSRV